MIVDLEIGSVVLVMVKDKEFKIIITSKDLNMKNKILKGKTFTTNDNSYVPYICTLSQWGYYLENFY